MELSVDKNNKSHVCVHQGVHPRYDYLEASPSHILSCKKICTRPTGLLILIQESPGQGSTAIKPS